MDFKNNIIQQLESNRPNLSPSSATTYTSLLLNLLKKLNLESTLDSFVNHKEEIIAYIEDIMKSLQSKKTVLSALYILTNEEDYRTLMLEICKEVNDNYKQQKVAPNRESSFISFQQVQEKYEALKKAMTENPSLDNIQNVLIIALMSGVIPSIPPRRNEWAMVKIKDFDKDKDNYYEKGIFTFHKYKTDKVYGTQVIKVPKGEFNRILLKWLKLNKSNYLLCNLNTGKPFSSSDLSKKLKKIFGNQNIGCDQLRSIYLSHLYRDVPKLEELNEIATKMGHSATTAMTNYVKKDP